jgi:Icc-related predicted phosphoesterase
MSSKTTLMTVTDLHRSTGLLLALREVVAQRKPDIVALVGDFLHAFDDNEGRMTVEDCAEQLSKLPCPEIVFVRGNHEDEAWWLFAEAWNKSGRPLYALHGQAFTHGPLMILGFPCHMGDETAFIGDREPLAYDPDEWLPEVILSTGRAARTLWLMHEPPSGTPLSKRGSVVEGNPEWVQAIKRFSPWLTISGHDHRAPIQSGQWHCRIGQTTCVNVGQTDNGPLHYCFVEAEFAGTSTSLPTRMRVTAYPWRETHYLRDGKLTKSRSGHDATASDKLSSPKSKNCASRTDSQKPC